MKKTFYSFLFLSFWMVCLGALLSSCKSTPTARNAIAAGMPRRDVVLLMGSPDRVREAGEGKEILEYKLHKDINDPYAPDEPYWVFMQDGKVVRFGKKGEIEKTEFQDFEANISIS